MTISTIIALASFALSCYLYVRQRWERREASVGAQLERSEADRSLRLRLTNHGPHWADELLVDVQLRGGGPHRGVFRITSPTDVNELPIPRLHAGESYYLYGYQMGLAAEPSQAVLRWRDGRRSSQQRVVQLSIHPS